MLAKFSAFLLALGLVNLIHGNAALADDLSGDFTAISIGWLEDKVSDTAELKSLLSDQNSFLDFFEDEVSLSCHLGHLSIKQNGNKATYQDFSLDIETFIDQQQVVYRSIVLDIEVDQELGLWTEKNVPLFLPEGYQVAFFLRPFLTDIYFLHFLDRDQYQNYLIDGVTPLAPEELLSIQSENKVGLLPDFNLLVPCPTEITASISEASEPTTLFEYFAMNEGIDWTVLGANVDKCGFWFCGEDRDRFIAEMKN